MTLINRWRQGWLSVMGSMVLSVTCVAAEQNETERLKRQVEVLSASLAATKAEADALRAQLDGKALSVGIGEPVPVSGVEERQYRVVDVNRELGMVIVNGGRRDGFRPGLQFAVIQKDRTVASVRIVDVRTAVAGAVIQGLNGGFPTVNDRAVLVTGSRK